MKKAVIGLLMVGLITSGCTGSFQLTRKVYDFHRSQSEKWTDEIVFLIVSILPVYGLATTADALIFNSIEFWTGSNPVTTASNEDLKERTFSQGDKETTMAYDPATDQILVVAKAAGQPTSEFVLERSADGVVAKSKDGSVLFQSARSTDGSVMVFDGQAQLVRSYSADEVASLKSYGASN